MIRDPFFGEVVRQSCTHIHTHDGMDFELSKQGGGGNKRQNRDSGGSWDPDALLECVERQKKRHSLKSSFFYVETFRFACQFYG